MHALALSIFAAIATQPVTEVGPSVAPDEAGATARETSVAGVSEGGASRSEGGPAGSTDGAAVGAADGEPASVVGASRSEDAEGGAAGSPARAPAVEATRQPAVPAPESPARPRWWGPEPRPKISGYGGPAVRLTGLNGAFAALVGLEGGVNVVQRVTIGASLLWLLNPAPAGEFARGAANRINFNYGGVVVDVAYVRGRRVAGTLGGLIGGGGACLQNPENGACADKTSFVVGEPRTGLRVVLAPIVRLHLAFGWRFLAARAWGGPPEPRLGGPAGSITLEFGWF